MKHLTILLYFITYITACSNVKIQDERKNFALSLIDNFLQEEISLNKLRKSLGNPHKTHIFKDTPNQTAYFYRNKKNNLHEWSFGVDNSGHVVWINHTPWFNPLLDRAEILPQTWKKYRCQKKTKPDKRTPHVIRQYTFFECARGKIRAYYNKYGEISDIAVSK